MSQQPNMFTEDINESPELVQAIIESYLEANPLIKTCAQGIIQFLTSFSNNSYRQNQESMDTNNTSKENDNKSKSNNNKDDNDDDDDDDNNKESNQNDNSNNNDDKSTQNSKENPDMNIFSNLLKQFCNMSNEQQCPFLSQIFQNSNPNSSKKEKNYEQEENKQEADDELLIQDIIIQTLNPEIFESSSNHTIKSNSSDDNKNDNSNEENVKHQDQVLDIIEMIKVLYQLYLQDKNRTSNFINHFNDAIINAIKLFPKIRSLFDSKQKQESNDENKIFDFGLFNLIDFLPFLDCNPFFEMMNHIMNQSFCYSSQNQQFEKNNKMKEEDQKKAELKRTKQVDSDGIITLIIRRSIGDRWYEIEQKMKSEEETIKTTKETWNNISEDEFNDFTHEWEILYKIQNENEK